MSKKIEKAAEAIKEELQKPLPDHQPQEEKKMATKKKSRKKVTRKKKVTKKVRKKGAAKKKAASKKKAVDGTTLAELAEEAGISGQKARQKLRSAGLEREKGSRWVFTNAKELKAARKALGL